MDDDDKLYRQISPKFFQDGTISSQAFRPLGGKTKLSLYNGLMITPKDAYVHYTETLHNQSDGVAEILVGSFTKRGLEVIPDGEGFDEHVSADFSNIIHSRKELEKVSRNLRDEAKMVFTKC
jgi:hypothetical protein